MCGPPSSRSSSSLAVFLDLGHGGRYPLLWGGSGESSAGTPRCSWARRRRSASTIATAPPAVRAMRWASAGARGRGRRPGHRPVVLPDRVPPLRHVAITAPVPPYPHRPEGVIGALRSRRGQRSSLQRADARAAARRAPAPLPAHERADSAAAAAAAPVGVGRQPRLPRPRTRGVRQVDPARAVRRAARRARRVAHTHRGGRRRRHAPPRSRARARTGGGRRHARRAAVRRSVRGRAAGPAATRRVAPRAPEAADDRPRRRPPPRSTRDARRPRRPVRPGAADVVAAPREPVAPRAAARAPARGRPAARGRRLRPAHDARRGDRDAARRRRAGRRRGGRARRAAHGGLAGGHLPRRAAAPRRRAARVPRRRRPRRPAPRRVRARGGPRARATRDDAAFLDAVVDPRRAASRTYATPSCSRDDSAERLRALVGADLLVMPPDASRSAYRVHALFRSLLEAELRSRGIDEERALHARASAVLPRAGRLGAGDPPRRRRRRARRRRGDHLAGRCRR